MNNKTEGTSVDALKANYLHEKEIHMAKMEAELRSLGNRTKKIGTAALVVGGVLLVGYIVGRKMLSSKKRTGLPAIPSTHLMVQQPKSEPAIITVIKEQIPLYLMAIIKEKLTAYIKTKAVDDKK
jgi:hypothetical protein